MPESMDSSPYAPPLRNAARTVVRSPTFRLLVVAALVLALLIPLAMVRGLVSEREQRYAGVVAEIAGLWGGEQLVGGPLLSIPYVAVEEDELGRRHTRRRSLHVMPARLEVDAVLEPQRRHRGLYEVVVYELALTVRGEIELPDPQTLPVPAESLLWSDADLTIGVSDPRGIAQPPRLELADGEVAELVPGPSPFSLFQAGLRADLARVLSAPTAAAAPRPLPFSYRLELDGSQSLQFLPLAKESRVALAAAWADPSFGGSFLPSDLELDDQGFDASWQVSYFGTGLPAVWTDGETNELDLASRLSRSRFGLSLFLPADHYQKTERVVKYGILFLALTLGSFFLFEVFRPVQVHVVQYLLVGFALCIFYLLLLSLSEHTHFALAYLASSVATVSLITSYARSVLGGGRRAALLGTVLAGLYAYLYILLQAAEYSLLLGSTALFAVLATVMFVTRRIDWHSLGRSASATQEAVDTVA